MTNSQIEEHLQKNYRVRNSRLADALRNGATRMQGKPRMHRHVCMICRRVEQGGGLLPYRQRDGEELFLGERCAAYLDYLATHPNLVKQLLN
jgi:hypothetical protein